MNTTPTTSSPFKFENTTSSPIDYLKLLNLSSSVVKEESIIVEFGSKITKCGFGGESKPRAIFPTSFKIDNTGEELYFNKIGLKSAIEYDKWEKALEGFLLKLFFHHLLINPKEHKFVICEEITMPVNFKEALTKLLLKQYGIPAILFVSSSLVSLLPLESRTAIVIDIGYSGLSITPIYEGNMLIHASKVSQIGIKQVLKRLKDTLVEHGQILDRSTSKRTKVQETDLTEELLLSLSKQCAVIQFKKSPNFTKKLPQYQLSEKYLTLRKTEKLDVLVPMDIRSHTTEVFFEGDEEGDSLPSLILESLIRCPFDTRLALCSNIVVKGGGYFFGMRDRILNEVTNLSQLFERYKSFAALSPHFNFVDNDELNLTYLGASMIGSVINLLSRKDGILNSTDFEQYGFRNDWTCISPMKTPITPSKSFDFDISFSPYPKKLNFDSK